MLDLSNGKTRRLRRVCSVVIAFVLAFSFGPAATTRAEAEAPAETKPGAAEPAEGKTAAEQPAEAKTEAQGSAEAQKEEEGAAGAKTEAEGPAAAQAEAEEPAETPEEAEVPAGAQAETNVLTAKGTQYEFTLEYGSDAGIPEGATLHVNEMRAGGSDYGEYVDQAAAALDPSGKGSVSFARVFDVEIHDALGRELEPKAAVSVKIGLADAPEDQDLSVVHFEEDGPAVMEPETNGGSEVSFETGSFSAYAVLVQERKPENVGVNDLAGKTMTFRHEGRYVTSNVDYGSGDPFRLGKTTDPGDAAVWGFEDAGEGYGYKFYHIYTIRNGEKRYLHFGVVWNNHDMAHATLERPQAQGGAQGCPQNFAVERNSDGTYSIFIAFPEYNYLRQYLNEFGGTGGNGFAGWHQNDNGSHLNFDFQTTQPMTEPGEYAVIIKDEATGKYYEVEEDGELEEVLYDETTGVARVKLNKPLAWRYTSVWDGLSEDTKSFDPAVNHPDWEPFNLRIHSDARDYDPGTQLAEGFYYRFISPEKEKGLDQEDKATPSHDTVKWASALRIEDHKLHGITWDENLNTFLDTTHYLGADFDSLKIKGMVSKDEAATVFLARITDVPDTGQNNETVSHIDIAINAKGHMSVPLAYGTYYNKAGEPVLKITPETPREDAVLDLVEDIPVTRQDLMEAHLYAYDKDGNQLDDVYYITGYSENEHTEHSLIQVRMEGSFKVTTLPPYNGWRARANDDETRRAERLENQIYYEMAIDKEVTFHLKHNGVQLYDHKGNELTNTVTAPVEARFSYWDQGDQSDGEAPEKGGDPYFTSDGNECPAVEPDFEELYSFMFPREADHISEIAGRNNRWWKDGAIIDNNQSYDYMPYGFPPYIGDSGMDFILHVNVNLDNARLAYEIEKNIVDEDGNLLKFEKGTEIENNFKVFYSEDADPDGVIDYAVPEPVKDASEKQTGYDELDDISMTVGEEGTDIYYDYEVEDGMVYIEEDSAPLKEGGKNYILTDKNGDRWRYKKMYTETEYVWRKDGDETDDTDHPWREDGDHAKRHIVEGCSGVPDVVGDYGDGLRNGFLEFHVYNIYEKIKYPVYLKKTNDGGAALEGAKFAVYGPYAKAPAEPKQNDKKIGTVTTDGDGIVKIGDLTKPGLYYVYETKAPDGYVKASDPVVITIDPDDAKAPVKAEGAAGGVETVTREETDTYQFTVINDKKAPAPDPNPDDDKDDDDKPAPGPDDGNGGVRTGDDAPLVPMLLLLAASSVLAGVLIRRRDQ